MMQWDLDCYQKQQSDFLLPEAASFASIRRWQLLR